MNELHYMGLGEWGAARPGSLGWVVGSPCRPAALQQGHVHGGA